MYQFASTEFAVGTVFGVRAWRYSSDGTLTGVTYRQPWGTGVNEATCMSGLHEVECLVRPQWFYVGTASVYMGAGNPPSGSTCECDLGCDDLIDPDCGCGYWAYWTAANMNYGGSIVGIIEAHGKVTEGTRGFRAEKARLVALCMPEPTPPAQFVPRKYSRRERWALAWFRRGPQLFDPFGFWELGRGLSNTEAEQRRAFERLDNFRRNKLGVAPLPDDVAAKIRDRYPDVPIYTTVAEMVAAHPLTPAPTEEQP